MKATGTSAPLTGSIAALLYRGRRPGSVERGRQAAAMLSRELVIGAQLGEDADHRLADQITAVRILGVGDRLLERIQGGCVVAVIPGRERRRQPLIGLAAVLLAQV